MKGGINDTVLTWKHNVTKCIGGDLHGLKRTILRKEEEKEEEEEKTTKQTNNNKTKQKQKNLFFLSLKLHNKFENKYLI